MKLTIDKYKLFDNKIEELKDRMLILETAQFNMNPKSMARKRMANDSE